MYAVSQNAKIKTAKPTSFAAMGDFPIVVDGVIVIIMLLFKLNGGQGCNCSFSRRYDWGSSYGSLGGKLGVI